MFREGGEGWREFLGCFLEFVVKGRGTRLFWSRYRRWYAGFGFVWVSSGRDSTVVIFGVGG